MGGPVQSSGRLLEHNSDVVPRGMIVHDRTRLIDQLTRFQRIVFKRFAFFLSSRLKSPNGNKNEISRNFCII